jgi:hypothetical protein
MSTQTIATFREAVEAGEAERVLVLLAEEITFNNPVTFEPFRGRETLAVVVPKLLDVWQGLRYVDELHSEDQVGLVFEARAGTRDVTGVDLLRFNEDGLITDVTVMVRPMSGLHALAREMQNALATG